MDSRRGEAGTREMTITPTEKPSKTGSTNASLALKEIQESIETKQKLSKECLDDIVEVASQISNSLSHGGKVVFFGNGGSAADAQHLAAELVGKFAAIRPPLRAMALTTNTSILTAVGNDFNFDEIFSRQITGQLDKGDIAIGISTSGRSRNVIKGIEEAHKIGAKTVALTGAPGGELANLCDYRVKVPSNNTQRIQESHILVGHILCSLIEHNLATPNR